MQVLKSFSPTYYFSGSYYNVVFAKTKELTKKEEDREYRKEKIQYRKGKRKILRITDVLPGKEGNQF